MPRTLSRPPGDVPLARAPPVVRACEPPGKRPRSLSSLYFGAAPRRSDLGANDELQGKPAAIHRSAVSGARAHWTQRYLGNHGEPETSSPIYRRLSGQPVDGLLAIRYRVFGFPAPGNPGFPAMTRQSGGGRKGRHTSLMSRGPARGAWDCATRPHASRK